MKQIGNITVNDGKGLYDNEGLCDSLIVDCNNAVKSLTGGNYVQFCGIIVQMVKKLANLKEGIKNDMDSMRKQVAELEKLIDSLYEQKTGIPVDKDGEQRD
jgi:hypothetical protein